jgi:hypothetical protein
MEIFTVSLLKWQEINIKGPTRTKIQKAIKELNEIEGYMFDTAIFDEAQNQIFMIISTNSWVCMRCDVSVFVAASFNFCLCYAISCYGMTHHVMPCHVMSCHATSCHLNLSDRILHYLISPYPIFYLIVYLIFYLIFHRTWLRITTWRATNAKISFKGDVLLPLWRLIITSSI